MGGFFCGCYQSSSSTRGGGGGGDKALIEMEERMQQAERRAKLAEDRAQQNDHLLQYKMSEMNQLHGSLTQQSKVSASTHP